MKKTIKIISFIMAFTLIASICLIKDRGALAQTTVYSLSFEQIGGKDVMPIGCWWGPYEHLQGSFNGNNFPDYITDEYYEMIKDCGMNFVTVSNDNYALGGEKAQCVHKSLDLCKKYGLGYFVYDSFVKETKSVEELQKQIAPYINDSACIGIHVLDEPYANKFDDFTNVYENYATLPYVDKPLYINLLPRYVKNPSGNTSRKMTWEEYIDEFLTKVPQDFLSFDDYIYFSGYNFKETDNSVANMSGFFSALATAGKVANKHEVPFWVFIQSGGQWNDAGKRDIETGDPYPSEGEMLWNINMCLAYGAKAIQYFTFLQPLAYGYAVDDCYDASRNCLVGANGCKNRWYYYAQKANKQISAVDHVLMNSSFMGVIAKGEVANKNILGEEKIESGTYKELTSVTSNDAVVGCFDYNGKTALYVVNNSVKEKNTVNLKFGGKKNIEVIQRAVSVKKKTNNITLTLETGEGALVVIG